MAATVIETALDRIKTVLSAALPGRKVERGRDTAVSPTEGFVLNIRRRNVEFDALGLSVLQITFTVELEFWAPGAGHETANDSAHDAAHIALLADPILAPQITQPISTDTESETGEAQVGLLTARYQLQLQCARNSLSTPI